MWTLQELGSDQPSHEQESSAPRPPPPPPPQVAYLCMEGACLSAAHRQQHFALLDIWDPSFAALCKAQCSVQCMVHGKRGRQYKGSRNRRECRKSCG